MRKNRDDALGARELENPSDEVKKSTLFATPETG
jgi:hypothetical protein